MKRIDVVVIGAGQAGLAISHELTALGIDHVVLERGQVAERWRSDRWDTLRLLTPNWHSRLPGYRYTGPDPDGFMTMPEVIDYLTGYSRTFSAPVIEHATVISMQPSECCGYRVMTSRGTWIARAVVIATGQCERVAVPPIAKYLAPEIAQILPNRYRRPSDVPDGGVLVVGASATGVQLADELQAAGRQVTLAVGQHTRLPRSYRGKDIVWWMDQLGLFEERAEAVADLRASRRQPSLQLVGRPDHATLGLMELRERGVRLVGRLRDLDGRRAVFSDDLVATMAAADLKLAGLLQRIDRFSGNASAAQPFTPSWPVAVQQEAPEQLNLRLEGIRSVVWATGYRPHFPWLEVPVLDAAGGIRHAGGITPAPGLYVMGLTFLRRRKSTFIDGVGDDARELAVRVAADLGHDRPDVIGGAAIRRRVSAGGNSHEQLVSL